jgi:hypothetical protein
MAELSTGVRTLLARMESNPEEFYGEADKWRFMFAPNFREVMTEPEKGALHEALCEVRRKEFDERVMRRLLQDDMDEQARDARSRYGTAMAHIKGAGSVVAESTKLLDNSFNDAYNQAQLKRHVEANNSARNNSFI